MNAGCCQQLFGVVLDIVREGLERILPGVDCPDDHIQSRNQRAGSLGNFVVTFTGLPEGFLFFKARAGQQAHFCEPRPQFIVQIARDSGAFGLNGSLALGIFTHTNFLMQAPRALRHLPAQNSRPDRNENQNNQQDANHGEQPPKRPPRRLTVVGRRLDHGQWGHR